MNKWMNEWLNEWMNESVNEWSSNAKHNSPLSLNLSMIQENTAIKWKSCLKTLTFPLKTGQKRGSNEEKMCWWGPKAYIWYFTYLRD